MNPCLYRYGSSKARNLKIARCNPALLDGKDYYIPAVAGDAKEHSKPDGLYQPGVPFDPNRVTVTGDGSSVEFIGYDIATFVNANGDIKTTVNYTNDFRLIELIIYDGIVNY